MGPFRRFAAAFVLSLCSESVIAQEAEQHPQSWWESPYGEDDRIGAANNMTADGVRRAAGLVTTGKVYELGVHTGPSTPAFGEGRSYSVERLSSTGDVTTSDGSQRVTAFDEKVTLSMGIGTQIDGLAHLGVDNHHYNGVSAVEVAEGSVLQTSDIPPFVTRGVLIDMAKHYGVDRLEAGTAFNRAEIQAAATAQGVTVGRGDVVLFHTGWMSIMESDPETYRNMQPGIGEDGAIYLADMGVVAIGADTVALEAIPFEDPAKVFIVHQTLLAKKGVYVLETIDTRALAADGVKEFMFVAAAPRFDGTVQVVVNPVAIR